MRVSLRHVAERAGVSRVTASNVLNGRSNQVSPDTRRRVAAAMRDLNYVPVAPPSLQTRHVATRTIGLIFDYIDVEDEWGLGVYHGLRRGAQKNGYDLLTILRKMPDDLIDSDLRFLDRRSDGLIFISPRERTAVLQTLVEHKVPVISCFQTDVPHGVPCVTIDDADAMRQAVDHLMQAGHKRILHLAGQQTRDDFRLRRKGYCDAMRAAGLEPQVIALSDGYDETWREAVLSLVARREISAVVCASDNLAFNLKREVVKCGLRVPHDLSIIGMDNLPLAAENGLTTLSFDIAAVGYAAIESLIHIIEGGNVQNHIVPVQLIERSSVAAPPNDIR